MKKTTYNIEYNPVSKTWCLFKYVEGSNSYNFYPIVQSVDKKDCQAKLDEINKKIQKGKEKISKARKAKKGIKAIYNLYYEGKLIDADTKENLLKKHKDLRHNHFYNYYFYKKGTKYKVEKVTK